MSWFGSTEAENIWSTRCDEFEYEVNMMIELTEETLNDMKRLRDCIGKLRDVKHQYQGSHNSVLETLAHKFDQSVGNDIRALISDLQSARTSATHIGRTVDALA